jgi:hypothetical protein
VCVCVFVCLCVCVCLRVPVRVRVHVHVSMRGLEELWDILGGVTESNIGPEKVGP